MKKLIALSSLLILSACTSVPFEPDVYPNDPNFAPVSAQSLQPPPSVSGSLFNPAYTNGFFTDQQARRVGDIITVIFDERYRSSKSAETTMEKDSSATITPTAIAGMVPGWRNVSLTTDYDSEKEFYWHW